jgi:hypothetical protein
VTSLNLIIDRMTNINMQRAALVKGHSLIDAMRADDTEPTIRQSFNVALKKYEKHSISQHLQGNPQQFFQKGGKRLRNKPGYRHKRPKPPEEGAGGRNTQREGALYRGPASSRQKPGYPQRGKKKPLSGNRRPQA